MRYICIFIVSRTDYVCCVRLWIYSLEHERSERAAEEAIERENAERGSRERDSRDRDAREREARELEARKLKARELEANELEKLRVAREKEARRLNADKAAVKAKAMEAAKATLAEKKKNEADAGALEETNRAAREDLASRMNSLLVDDEADVTPPDDVSSDHSHDGEYVYFALVLYKREYN